ncbi:uncharacterized protein [Physeter macrocephalus]|uniref:Uncharacterized protein n=1 Tax=Physeter macrocephalus TaxID=9755 RepID=A0A9W2WU11_PHYMC|nr:uncharacterized protein LOC129392347 [Physeter catodon]
MGELTRHPNSGQERERGIRGFELLPAESAWQLSAPNHHGKVARAEREPTQQGTDSSPARSLSSTFRRVAGATQAGSNQGPQAPVPLSRPTPATWHQTVLSRYSKVSAASAPRADEEQESVPSLAHIVQMGKQSGEDTPLPHGPSGSSSGNSLCRGMLEPHPQETLKILPNAPTESCREFINSNCFLLGQIEELLKLYSNKQHLWLECGQRGLSQGYLGTAVTYECQAAN